MDQERSSRLADRSRRAVEDEDEDGLGGDAEAAGRDKLAMGSVDRMGVSMAAVAEVVVDSARRHAPWTAVWLEVEEVD